MIRRAIQVVLAVVLSIYDPPFNPSDRVYVVPPDPRPGRR